MKCNLIVLPSGPYGRVVVGGGVVVPVKTFKV